MKPLRFDVHYGRAIKAISALGACVLLSVPAFAWFSDAEPAWLLAGITVVAVLTLGASALFAVRGYELDAEGLYVLRPVGRLLAARRVKAIETEGLNVWKLLRVFGNGGLFSFSGWFRMRGRGVGRVWVTDPANLVLLETDARWVMLSPADRAGFIAALRERFRIEP